MLDHSSSLVLPRAATAIFLMAMCIFLGISTPARAANPGKEALAAEYNPPPSTSRSSASDDYTASCSLILQYMEAPDFEFVDAGGNTLDSCITVEPFIAYCKGESQTIPPLKDLGATLSLVASDEKPTCAASLDTFRGSPASSSATTPMAFGADWQEDLVKAVAAFLVKRAKAEALAWASEHMAAELCSSEGGSAAFPTTCGLLFTDESSARGVSWAAVREAAIDDFRKLPENVLVEVVGRLAADASPEQKVLLADATLALGASIKTVRAIIDGHGAAEALAGLVGYIEAKHPVHDGRSLVANVLWIGGFVANEFRYEVDEHFKQCLKDPKRCEAYRPNPEKLRNVRNLLVTQLSPQFAAHPRLRVWLESTDNSDKLAAFVYVLQELTALAGQVQTATDAQNKGEKYTKYLDALSRFFEVGADIAESIQTEPARCEWSDPSPEAGACAVSAMRAAGGMVKVADSLRRREYSSALARSVVLLNQAAPGTSLPPWLRDWVPFLAALATATDSDSMQAALEAFAAPVGGYKMKRGNTNCVGLGKRPCRKKAAPRRRNFHASLNGYLGVASGGEVLLDAGGWGGHIGPAASIGVEVGWGWGRSSSFSFYAPVLDLGSLLDFRLGGNGKASGLTNEDVETTAQLGVAQVFAPGLFGVVGLGRSPIALGVGVQFAPELRKTEPRQDPMTMEDIGTADRYSVLQIGGFLAIDIPIWIIR